VAPVAKTTLAPFGIEPDKPDVGPPAM
jgi:hypothetical protein